jgi:hypothetical protein
MTTRRALAAAAAAAALAVAVPAALPAAAAAPVPVLAGRTEIVAGKGSTRMTVRVPRAVTLPSGYVDVRYVRVDGTADAAIAYLLPRRRPLMDTPAAFGRLGRGVGHPTVGNGPAGTDRVAAGVYDLVVVHSPGTARITVTFPGLSGRTTLRPTAPSAAALKALSVAPLPAGGYGPAGSTGGVAGTLGATGFVDVRGVLRASTGGATRIVTCLRAPDDVTPPPADFAPECPGLRSAAFLLLAGPFRYFNGTFLNWGRGAYAGGFAYEGAMVPVAAGGFVAFVPLP